MIKRKLSQDKKERFFSCGSYIADPKPVLPIIQSKIVFLIERFEDEKFINAVAEKAGYKDQSGNDSRLGDMKRRLEITHEIVKQELENLIDK